MVIPWVGIPARNLIKKAGADVEGEITSNSPRSLDPKRMPGQCGRDSRTGRIVEGLRMDEAMHPLALLAVGLYGEALPHQDGAPLRLVVPWKYGFKGVKSIVKIRFIEKQPLNTLAAYAPRTNTAFTRT